jgi:hypothetical protein
MSIDRTQYIWFLSDVFESLVHFTVGSYEEYPYPTDNGNDLTGTI